MRKLLLVIMVYSAICFGCTPTDTVTNTNTNKNTNAVAAVSPTATPVRAPSPVADDKTLAMNTAQNGIAEVALGRLAATKAKSADVKRFAQRVVTDHTKVGVELKKIATAKNIALPTQVKPEQQATYDRLSKLSGAEFDREFMKVMVESHDKSVAAFQAEANNGTDPEIKAFATKTLPTLQEHQRMAHEIDGKLTT